MSDDYAVVDGTTIVGRIYREMIIGKPKWRWFRHEIPEAVPGARFNRPIREWPRRSMRPRPLSELRPSIEHHVRSLRLNEW